MNFFTLYLTDMGNTISDCSNTQILKKCLKNETLIKKAGIENILAITDLSNEEKNEEILESYEPSHNYFYLAKSILTIQSEYRRFKSYKKYINAKTSAQSKGRNNVCEKNSISSFTYSNINSINLNSTNGSSQIKGLFVVKKKKFKYRGSIHPTKRTKEGFGIIKWEDGSTLCANFVNNKSTGICKFNDVKNGNVFSGQYVNNRPKGYGISSEKSQVIYEGIWNDNLLTGLGRENWKDGTFYQGEYFENKKEGIGLYRWPDGTIYQGEWKGDQINGSGIILYNDERIYEGEVAKGLMNGYGLFSWPDGKRYIGHYKNNQKDGFGIFLWAKEPFQGYIGLWKDGKMEGPGMKINGESLKYGLWRCNQKRCWLAGHWEVKENLPSGYEGLMKIFEKDVDEIKKVVKLLLEI